MKMVLIFPSAVFYHNSNFLIENRIQLFFIAFNHNLTFFYPFILKENKAFHNKKLSAIKLQYTKKCSQF